MKILLKITFFRLCIEDIPLASINKKLNLRLQDSKIKRRMCQVVSSIFEIKFLIIIYY